MRRIPSVVAIALCAAVLPPAAANAAPVRIAGTIIPGSDGTCAPPSVDGPHVHWQCSDATETYTGGMSSTADAVYSVRGSFNSRSGVTRTSGTETFTGCVGSACGMLEWNWHVTFTTAPETLEVLGGHGQARITGGTGALAGAKGSFTIACDPSAPCTYEGHVSP